LVKLITSILISILAINLSFAETQIKKSKRSKKSATHSRVVSKKQTRKSRRRHHGTGPDLKSITTDSPYSYTDDPNNGVNPIETKQQ
jgi:hypothetical protein